MKDHKIYIIVAVDEEGGIGKNGKLPWHFKKEMQFFKETTLKTSDPKKQNMVIMGRRTWQSIPRKFQPLPNRHNIVLTTNPDFEAPGAEIFSNLEKAIHSADQNIERIFIIGGAQVFAHALKNPQLTGIYLTQVYSKYDCDTYMEKIPKEFSPLKIASEQEKGIKFDYLLYQKTT